MTTQNEGKSGKKRSPDPLRSEAGSAWLFDPCSKLLKQGHDKSWKGERPGMTRSETGPWRSRALRAIAGEGEAMGKGQI